MAKSEPSSKDIWIYTIPRLIRELHDSARGTSLFEFAIDDRYVRKKYSRVNIFDCFAWIASRELVFVESQKAVLSLSRTNGRLTCWMIEGWRNNRSVYAWYVQFKVQQPKELVEKTNWLTCLAFDRWIAVDYLMKCEFFCIAWWVELFLQMKWNIVLFNTIYICIFSKPVKQKSMNTSTILIIYIWFDFLSGMQYVRFL